MSDTSYSDRLISAIKKRGIKVVSFDFFDTLMARKVRHPADAFLVLGRRLLDQGMFELSISAERFMRLRIEAEVRARQAAQLPEVTIEEIYAQFPPGLFRAERGQLVAAEIAVEASLLFPIAPMVEMVKLAARRGKAVVVVSDTYYSGAQLAAFWNQAAPGVAVRFFTSSDFRSGKSEGLFGSVLKELGLKTAELIHAGDNVQSDYAVPSRQGVTAFLIPHGSAHLTRLVEAERGGRDLAAAWACDGGLAALRGKTVAELTEEDATQPTMLQYGAQILGPILSPFVRWVGASAADIGCDLILPLMREGHMLARLLSMSECPIPIEPAYLSRRLLFRAALHEANAEQLEALRFGNLNSSVKQYLDLLGMVMSDAPTLRRLAHRSIDDGEVFAKVLEVLSVPACIEQIRGHALEARRGIVAHWRRLCAAAPGPVRTVALVDLGWNGTIQRLLQELADEEGLDFRVVGLYLMTTERVNQLAFKGVLTRGFLVDGGSPQNEYRALIRTLEILEQSCSPAHGAVAGHDPVTGEPWLGPDLIPVLQRADINDVQSGMELFHRLYVAHTAALASPDDEGVRMECRRILLRAMLAPTPEEAMLFKAWVHDDNLATGAALPLMGSEHFRRAAKYMSAEQLRQRPMTEVYWPAGALALAAPMMAARAGQTALNLVSAALLDEALHASSELATLASARDDSEAEERAAQRIVSNLSGRSYLSFTLPVQKGQRLRWTPSQATFELTVDFVNVHVMTSGGTPVVTRFDGADLDREFGRAVGLLRVGQNRWRTASDASGFYFDDTRVFGLVGDGILTMEIACSLINIDSADSGIGPDNGPFMLRAGMEISQGLCHFDAVAGQSYNEAKGAVVLDDQILTLNGWMIDPQKRMGYGHFIARISNAIGESRFVQLEIVTRIDIANKYGRPDLERSGFVLQSYHLPAGAYSLTVLYQTESRVVMGARSIHIVSPHPIEAEEEVEVEVGVEDDESEEPSSEE